MRIRTIGVRVICGLSVAVAVTLGAPGTAAAQTPPAASTQAARRLHLSFAPDGTVTLDAQNVAVRDILFEWARQCGCYVVNGDRLPAAPIPVPVQFTHAAQKTVLESLLRSTPGYVLTPRTPGTTGASIYQTIYIVAATTVPTSGGYVPAASPAVPLATRGGPDDELPPVRPLASGPAVITGDSPQGSTTPQRPSNGTPGFIPVPITPIGGTAPSPPGSAPGLPQTTTTAPSAPGLPQPMPVQRPGMPAAPIQPVQSQPGR